MLPLHPTTGLKLTGSECPLRKYGCLVLDANLEVLDINPMAETFLHLTGAQCVRRRATELIVIRNSTPYGQLTLLEVYVGDGRLIRIFSCVHFISQLEFQLNPYNTARDPSFDYLYRMVGVCSTFTISSYGIVLRGYFSRNLMPASDAPTSPFGQPVFRFIHLGDILPFCRSVRWVRERRVTSSIIRWVPQPLINPHATIWVELVGFSDNSTGEFAFVARQVYPFNGVRQVSTRNISSSVGLKEEPSGWLAQLFIGAPRFQDIARVVTCLRYLASTGLADVWARRFSFTAPVKGKAKLVKLVALCIKLIGSWVASTNPQAAVTTLHVVPALAPVLKFLTAVLIRLFHLIPFPPLQSLFAASPNRPPPLNPGPRISAPVGPGWPPFDGVEFRPARSVIVHRRGPSPPSVVAPLAVILSLPRSVRFVTLACRGEGRFLSRRTPHTVNRRGSFGQLPGTSIESHAPRQGYRSIV
ncbi:hypothetical protein L0F63_004083 [Massospora cicadina]|nr:hypothetical protein L0F63_004083 [Massospora cicadina]